MADTVDTVDNADTSYAVVAFHIDAIKSYVFDLHKTVVLHANHTLHEALLYLIETGYPPSYLSYYCGLVDKRDIPKCHNKMPIPIIAIWNPSTGENWVGTEIPERFKKIPSL